MNSRAHQRWHAPLERLDVPRAAESIVRLHRAGWSPTEIGTTPGDGAAMYVVAARNGARMIHAEGPTLPLAWWRACEAAAAVGMPADES